MHIQTQWFPLCAASNDKQISREDGTVHYAPLTQITQTLEDEQRIMDKAGRLSEPEIKKAEAKACLNSKTEKFPTN